MGSNLAPLFSSAKQDWATPKSLFEELSAQFGPFTLDVCASPENAKCSTFFTEADNGLAQSWRGVFWCNPPYGRDVDKWLKKGIEEIEAGNAAMGVYLLPARTDTNWFHNYIWRQPHTRFLKFLRGRVKFVGAPHAAPFPSMVVVFGR